MSEGVTVALIGLIGTLAGGLITWLVVRRKNQTDITETITCTALKLIQPLNERITELEAQVATLKRQVDHYLKRIMYLMGGITRLLAQLKDMNAEPCWSPDDWDPDDVKEQ